MPLTREEAVDLIEMFGSACLDNAQYAEQHDQGDMYGTIQYHLCEERRQRLMDQLLDALCASDEATLIAMRVIEWVSHPGLVGNRCLWCKGAYPTHKADCARQAVLKAAEEG